MRRPTALLPIVIIMLLAAGYLLLAGHPHTGSGASTSWNPLPVGGTSTTLINGSVFLYTEAKGLDKGVVFGGVLFKRLNVLTTGCRIVYYLTVFPDGAVEKLGINYGCPSFVSRTTTTRRHHEAWSRHASPRAGLIQDNNHLFILVSKSGARGWRMLAFNTSGDWVVIVLRPPGSTGRLLYEAVYTGPGFEALPSSLPPTPCGITVTHPSGNKTLVFERGICPWIRSKTWISPGYVYRYWVDLGNVMQGKGKYNVVINVDCVIPAENPRGGNPLYKHISTMLSFSMDVS